MLQLPPQSCNLPIRKRDSAYQATIVCWNLAIPVVFIHEETTYVGLNGRDNTLKNIITLQDEAGPYGSPFVDSARTAVTEDTTEALQIVFLRPSLKVEESNKLLESMASLFTQIHGGDFKTNILNTNFHTSKGEL